MVGFHGSRPGNDSQLCPGIVELIARAAAGMPRRVPQIPLMLIDWIIHIYASLA